MLTRFDDYPIHQTPEPIAHPASSDRNVYDRYWYNGFAKDGEFYFGVAMGRYPHRGVLDCAFSIVRDGMQHNFHGSRRAPDDPGDTSVGPFRIEIVEPMKIARVVLEPNETGIECDLTFTARTACVEEGRQTSQAQGRIMMDATRFAQWGRWQGVIRYAGQELAVDAERTYGTKDRSWGVRRVGEPEVGGAPGRTPPQFYFMWAPTQFDDCCTHFGRFEDGRGQAWHQGGAITPTYDDPAKIPVQDPGTQHFPFLERSITWEPGTRRARAAEITLVGPDERHVIQLEPLLCFRMKGIGYGHPQWSHGVWKGELAIGGDSWKCDELDELAPDNLHVQQVMRARWGDRVGVGVLEQIVVGPHEPSGFTGTLDGAK
jgi:hypothetical protein